MTQSTLKASAASWKPPTTDSEPPAASSGPGAWGKKPSDAIRKATRAPQQRSNSQNQSRSSSDNNQNSGWRRGVKQQQQDSEDKNSNWSRGNRNDGAGRGGGRGRGNRNNRNRNQYNKNNNDNDGGWQRGKSLPVELIKPGEGSTPAQKEVRRISVEELLGLRMSFVAPPLLWTEQPEVCPPEPALWNSETRVSEIDAMHKQGRVAGDVSHTKRRNKKNDSETAPPLEDCAPLKVNEETRWKSSVFEKTDDANDEEQETDDDVLKKALLVLNKLSLTKFDKLSDAFIDSGIGRNEECLKQAISLVVGKAQSEPHFANMYASLCLKLGRTPMEALGEEGKKKGKKFKKLLLERCQQEFEEDTAHKIARVTEDISDPEEKQYHANIIRKNYLGHMRFIGELYKGDMIRIGIMLFCLYGLLGMCTDEFTNTESTEEEKAELANGPVDEEKIECFSKLMTTIGYNLEQQAGAARDNGKPVYLGQLESCWKTVNNLAKKDKKGTKPRISNRIKFMLQDLMEMKKKGWKTRRKEETAKTIEQIHKEVAKEERAMKKRGSSSNLQRMSSRSSSGDIRNLDRQKIVTDADGFTTVSKGSGISRSVSSNSLRRNGSTSSNRGKNDGSSKPRLKKSASGGSFAMLRDSGSKKDKSTKPPLDVKPQEKPKEKKEYKAPRDCGKSSIIILKEYIVGGDMDDAVLSIFELIGSETDDGALERGTAIIDSSCGHVLECKAEDVDKYLTLFMRCANEKKISAKMFEGGFSGVLEFLRDIIIDAPLAETHMSKIAGTFVKSETLKFDFLLSTPEYFRTDGKAAQFAAKVMKFVGNVEDTSSVEVVEKLMTDDDREEYKTVQDLIASV